MSARRPAVEPVVADDPADSATHVSSMTATGQTTRLWRAAPTAGAYFGRGSYWTVSEPFAGRFAQWLTDTFGGGNTVYRADVTLSDVAEIPFGIFLPSDSVSQRVSKFASAGYQWLTFYEGCFDGDIIKQFVYLGDDVIPATPYPW